MLADICKYANVFSSDQSRIVSFSKELMRKMTIKRKST